MKGRSSPSRVLVSLRSICRLLSWGAAVTILYPCWGPEALAQENDQLYRIGFTRGIFKNKNENDVLASMKVWAQTLSKDGGVAVDPEMRIYESAKHASAAVRGNEVDALTLLLPEYTAFPEGLLSGPYIRDELYGNTYTEFVLVLRREDGSEPLESLRDAKLMVRDDHYDSLSIGWLNARVANAGLGQLTDLVSSLERNPKLPAVVLSVFFGNRDACLVTREGFESMAELNPQVLKRLSVAAASPPIFPSLFCFRSELPEPERQRLKREIIRLHEVVAGEQVLRVFKVDRMVEVTSGQLERSVGLLNEWNRAASERRPSPAEDQGGSR